jgi:hypothetical protein
MSDLFCGPGIAPRGPTHIACADDDAILGGLAGSGDDDVNNNHEDGATAKGGSAKCDACDGTGVISELAPVKPGMTKPVSSPNCPECGGTGLKRK